MSSIPIPPPVDHWFYPLYNALVGFKQGYIPPPTQYYVTRDDVLQLTVAAPSIDTTVNVSIRFMSAQGEVIPFYNSYSVTATAGSPKILTIPGAEGFLLSVSVFTPGAPRGQCFVSLAIKRGGGTGDNTYGDILLQGYPGAVGGLSYPQAFLYSPVDGRGLMRAITVANPAAGADWSKTVPAGVTWILRAVTATLTTGAAVATRMASLQVTDAAPHLLLDSPGGSSEVASLADVYSWFNSGAATALGLVLSGGLPAELRLPAGWIVQSKTAAIDAGDQWANVVLTVEEFVGG